mgnify:FL=1
MKAEFSRSAIRSWVRGNLTFREVSSDRDELNLRMCPKCGDTGYHVYFNLSRKIGYCHKGECVFGFMNLVEQVHGPGLDLNKIVEILGAESGPVFEEMEDGKSRPDILHDRLHTIEQDALLHSAVPRGFHPFLVSDPVSPEAAYALSRAPATEVFSGLWGTSTDRSLLDRVITIVTDPIGKPVFWQARTIHPHIKPKYLYATKVDTGLSASDVVGRIDTLHATSGAIAVVNEGLYSAISSDIPEQRAVGVCIFGHHISHQQTARLLAADPREVVLIQEPKEPNAKMLHRAMGFVKSGIPVSIIEMPEGDPNSHPELYRKLFRERKAV